MVIRKGEFDDEAAARIASVVAGRTVRHMSTYYKGSEQYLDIQFDENVHLRILAYMKDGTLPAWAMPKPAEKGLDLSGVAQAERAIQGRRPVEVSSFAKDDAGKTVRVNNGTGFFVQYGCDYDEYEAGPGSYTTAIVEMPDGTIRNLPLNMVQFIK